MKLTSIAATNFKGANFQHPLSEATAIIGPNMTGKTAIVQAIRLALAGWLPECGKTARATWELSSGPEMKVSMTIDNDGGDPKIACLYRRFSLSGSTVKEETDSTIDADQFENLPLLNTEAYFGMTDNERTAYVFERIKLPDTYTAAAIIAECERLSFEEKHSEQVQAAKKDLIRDVELAFEAPKWTGGLRPAGGAVDVVPSVQAALSDALSTFRERFTYWNKRAKDTQGAVKTLAELKLREKEVVAAAKGVEQEIDMVQADLDRLNNLKGKLTAEQDEAGRTEARKMLLRKQIHADREDYPRMIQKALDEKTALEGKLKVELDPGRREKMRGDLKQFTDQLSGMGGTITEQVSIINRAERVLTELSELSSCPYCKSTGANWKENLETEAKLAVKKARETHDSSMELRTKFGKQAAALEVQWLANEEAVQANIVLRLQIKDCDRQIAEYERAKVSDERHRGEMEEELRQMTQPSPASVDAEIERTIAVFKTQKEALTVLQQRRDAETRVKHDLKRAAEAELEHQEAAAHVLVIKAIAELLKGKREAMIEEAFGGLLKVANTVAGGILKASLALHENTVGMWADAKFIPHRVFSGIEKALCYIAIAVALSAQAPLKLVILDEFGRLDDENQIKVIEKLWCCLLDKIIDQFILVGTSLPRATPTNLQIIKVK